MKLKPLQDRIVVQRQEAATTTASGIVIPDQAAEQASQGQVLAVGPGKHDDRGVLHALDIQVGDQVLFSKFSGQTVKVDDQEYLILRQEDVMAVVLR